MSLKTSSTKAPFMFDLSFDETLNDDTPHILTTREVNQKIEVGRAEGFEEGQKAAKESLLASIKTTLEQVRLDVRTMVQNAEEFQSVYCYEIAEVCRKIAHKFYQHHVAEGVAQDILVFLQDHLETLKQLPQLTLSVAPKYEKDVIQLLEEYEPTLLKQLKITSDAQEETGYQLSWQYGSLVRETEQVLNKIDTVFQEYQTRIQEKFPDVKEKIQQSQPSSEKAEGPQDLATENQDDAPDQDAANTQEDDQENAANQEDLKVASDVEADQANDSTQADIQEEKELSDDNR